MCTNPITIYVNGEEKKIKCGKCDTCIRNKYQEWSIKLINEAKYHKKSCFITLTFDNKILLKGNKYGANCSFLFHIENSKEYFKKFIKRLRKKYKDKKITYFHVGEYGSESKRCHHHAIIYGINFEEDRIKAPMSKSGHIQYYSKTLQELWGAGLCTIQDTNSNNIIYTAQYTLKKFKTQEDKRYKAIISFSNRSKMSSKWIRRYPEEIVKNYIEDTDGKRYKIPKSYINTLKKDKKYEKILMQYEEKQQEYLLKSTDKERLKNAKIKEEQRQIRSQIVHKKRDL